MTKTEMRVYAKENGMTMKPTPPNQEERTNSLFLKTGNTMTKHETDKYDGLDQKSMIDNPMYYAESTMCDWVDYATDQHSGLEPKEMERRTERCISLLDDGTPRTLLCQWLALNRTFIRKPADLASMKVAWGFSKDADVDADIFTLYLLPLEKTFEFPSDFPFAGKSEFIEQTVECIQTLEQINQG